MCVCVCAKRNPISYFPTCNLCEHENVWSSTFISSYIWGSLGSFFIARIAQVSLCGWLCIWAAYMAAAGHVGNMTLNDDWFSGIRLAAMSYTTYAHNENAKWEKKLTVQGEQERCDNARGTKKKPLDRCVILAVSTVIKCNHFCCVVSMRFWVFLALLLQMHLNLHAR